MAESLGPKLVRDLAMAEFTSYQTGGKAAFFYPASEAKEVGQAINAARRYEIPLFLLGGGTNILVSDKGFDGLVVRVTVKGIERIESNQVRCGAGEQLEDLVDFATANGLTGIEFAAGIVGSVGGAVYGNAGAYGGEVGRIVSQMEVVKSDGVIGFVGAEFGQFAYRDSAFKRNDAVLIRADFQLEPGDPELIRKRVDEIIETREEKLPYEHPSAGCFFKNIPDDSQPHGKLAAGKLLEEIGAKGMTVGGATVSDRHANIIVNTGGATSKDIRELADKLKVKVYDKFGIMLEEEVIQVGEI
ncbi:MAG: UDP-N-acetylmuramate dehydrogenase [bacterium]|nr:UDP-N-acetylmuramate dehydrogenase [bacterium]